jgi:hypothetical protein
MTLRFASPPPEIVTAARQRALEQLPNATSIGAAHRVFVATPDDVLADRLLAGASETSIAFLVFAGENAIATIEGQTVVAGDVAASTLRAIDDASTIDGDHFEVRMLRVPALYFAALWLHGNVDVLITLPAGARHDEASLTAALRALAANIEPVSPT